MERSPKRIGFASFTLLSVEVPVGGNVSMLDQDLYNVHGLTLFHSSSETPWGHFAHVAFPLTSTFMLL